MQLGKYRHSKSGNFYQVIDTAIHTETREEMVVYKALYELPDLKPDQLFVRPKAMFMEMVEVNGEVVQRFVHVGE